MFKRASRLAVVAGIGVICLLMSSSPATAQCAPENCWYCTEDLWGAEGTGRHCQVVNGTEGRLCCDEWGAIYSSCRIYGDYCFGIIVRDI